MLHNYVNLFVETASCLTGNFLAKLPSSVGTWIKCFLLKISLGHSICLPPTLSSSACWWSLQENSCWMIAYVKSEQQGWNQHWSRKRERFGFSLQILWWVQVGGYLKLTLLQWCGFERPINTTNILINSSLSFSIETPLDDGEAFRNLCYEIQHFILKNFLP